MNAPPSPIAVMSMLCVAIPKDLTNVHVKADTLEMAKHALVLSAILCVSSFQPQISEILKQRRKKGSSKYGNSKYFRQFQKVFDNSFYTTGSYSLFPKFQAMLFH